MRTRIMKRSVLTLILLGSPTSVIAQTRCSTTQNHVIVNNKIQRHDGAGSLLQLLERHVNRHRLLLAAQSVDEQPYVLIDGVGVAGGVQRLADIPVHYVVSVTVLRPADAFTRFGPRAHKGAILVTTTTGLEQICNRRPMNPR